MLIWNSHCRMDLKFQVIWIIRSWVTKVYKKTVAHDGRVLRKKARNKGRIEGCVYDSMFLCPLDPNPLEAPGGSLPSLPTKLEASPPHFLIKVEFSEQLMKLIECKDGKLQLMLLPLLQLSSRKETCNCEFGKPAEEKGIQGWAPDNLKEFEFSC